MPFFYAPTNSIVEAMKYDGTQICAKRIINWVSRFLFKPEDDVILVGGNQFLFVRSDRFGSMQCEINKGDYVIIRLGRVVVLSEEEFNQAYEATPGFNP